MEYLLVLQAWIFIYDGSIGGNGASRALYDKFDKAIHRALKIISECPCEGESDCPRCIII